MADAEENNEKKPSHTLADHLYGQNIVHEHDEFSDHDHDHDYDYEDDDVPPEQNPLWRQEMCRSPQSASTSARRARRSFFRACTCAASPRI
jgi:hypothetical protein